MSVFVDDTRIRYGRMIMCHMVADTEAELHAMADAIGVQRRWYHRHHYNICLSKRAAAIKAGAVECSAQLAARVRRLMAADSKRRAALRLLSALLLVLVGHVAQQVARLAPESLAQPVERVGAHALEGSIAPELVDRGRGDAGALCQGIAGDPFRFHQRGEPELDCHARKIGSMSPLDNGVPTVLGSRGDTSREGGMNATTEERPARASAATPQRRLSGMGKKEPHRCEHCGDVVLIWRNCRKLDCITKRGEVA